MVFLKRGDFGIFFIFPIFGGDFGMILVEKNVWSFLVEKMGSPDMVQAFYWPAVKPVEKHV